MQELIDVVLKNPFLLILILGGLFSLFKGKSVKNREGHEEQQKDRRDAPTAERESNPPIERSTTRHVEEIQKSILNTLSIDEQREEQMKRLSNQFNVNEHSSLAGRPKIAAERRRNEIERTSSKFNKEFKKDLKNSLTRKGFANSIIMAEVLGAPRAGRPYQSVIDKRIKR